MGSYGRLLAYVMLIATLGVNAQPTLQKTGSRFSFSFGDLYLSVDTARGGRIVSLKYGGEELLYLQSTQDMNGSTFWPSPQSLWGWPPPANIDNKAYRVKISDNKLLLTGKVDATLNIRIYKSFAIDTTDTSVVINYFIKNEGSQPIRLAPWEVTRVPLKGPVVFMLEEGQVSGELASQTQAVDTHIWYDQENTHVAGKKFFANGMGWLAYLNINKRLIFIKKFPDTAANTAAPSEAEVELYTAGDLSYSELENQGKYTEIPGKDSMVYAVRWAVRKIPTDILIEIGNAQLTRFIDSLASHLRTADTIIISSTSYKFQPLRGNVHFSKGQIQLLDFADADFPLYLTLCDASGKTVLQKQVFPPHTIIPLRTLLPGIYLMNIINSQQLKMTEKIIVFESF